MMRSLYSGISGLRVHPTKMVRTLGRAGSAQIHSNCRHIGAETNLCSIRTGSSGRRIRAGSALCENAYSEPNATTSVTLSGNVDQKDKQVAFSEDGVGYPIAVDRWRQYPKRLI